LELFVKGDSKTIRWSMKIIFLIACAYFVICSIWINNDKSLIIVSCTYSRWLKQKYLNSGLDGYYIELRLPARPFWLWWLKQIMFSSFCWQSFHFFFDWAFPPVESELISSTKKSCLLQVLFCTLIRYDYLSANNYNKNISCLS
jgi:hypothetical protein